MSNEQNILVEKLTIFTQAIILALVLLIFIPILLLYTVFFDEI